MLWNLGENVPGRGNDTCKGPEVAVCLLRVRRQRRGREGRGEGGGESESTGDQAIWLGGHSEFQSGTQDNQFLRK